MSEMNYRYTGINENGMEVSGLIEAINLMDAALAVSELEIKLTSLKKELTPKAMPSN
tara:strand:- start:186 stop:356 length:171 start_codon:yes stop_codon:yes gene_type:complete